MADAGIPARLDEYIAALFPLMEANPEPLLAVPSSWTVLLAQGTPHLDDWRSLLFAATRRSLPHAGRQRHSPGFVWNDAIVRASELLELFDRFDEPSVLPYIVELLGIRLRANDLADWSRLALLSV